MTRKLTVLLMMVLAVWVLSGCVTYYSHPTKSQAQFNTDFSECNYAAELATAGMDVPDYDYTKTTRVGSLITTCLGTKGWSEYYE